MSLLVETIRLQEGNYNNLFYHEQRMNRSLKMLCGLQGNVDLEGYLKTKSAPVRGLYKCRVVYDDVSMETEFVTYQPKPITSLRIVEHDRISYEFKFTDRKMINRLYDLRKNCDDILIIKRGMVTDSSIANIVFRRDKKWYTPWAPLLKGTMRQKLLERGEVKEEEIRIKDIYRFESFKLINAMLEFESPESEVSNIVF